jgi:hypothetical protein
MTGMSGFLCRAMGRRLSAVVLSAAVLTSVVIAASSQARADWYETRRDSCTYLCHWYLTTGTCTGPFGVHVPCPLRKKRCSVDSCSQSQS